MEVLRQQTSTGAATRLPTSDGPPELAVADEFGLAVVNLGPGPAADRPASYGSLGKIVRMKVGDLDADGLPDMIVGSEGVEGSSWGVAVLWNSADGLFNRGLVTTIQALGFTSADMDAREGDELIAIDEEGRVQLHYQEAGHLTAGAVTSLPMELLPVTEVITVEAGDRDGDRLPDVIALVASGEAGDRLSLVEVRGAQGGEFAADATILWAGTAEASQDADPRPMLSTGDFDADGRMDCAVLSGRGKAISLLWGTGELGDLKFDSDIMSLGAGDLNGDDTSELILGFASQLKIFSFIDRGLAPIEQIEIAGSVGRLTVAEVDGVPPADIFYADLQARNVVLRRPDGGPSIVVVGQLIFNYELADLDLDGRANLIFYAGNSVFVRPTPAETPL